ncbi:MAG: hypothetical protein Q9220_007709 [cf. Caloplaca sp. 1 TL-2023]
MTNFTISIVSDTVCPWCYVGKTKLDRAISLYKSAHPISSSSTATDTFSITWHPFYLNPSAPKTGIDKHAYYLSKFGPERVPLMYDRMTLIGKSLGIADQVWRQDGEYTGLASEQLFRSYFEEEGDITDHEILTAAAMRGGLEEGEVRAWLGSGEGGREVDREVVEAQMKGVSGVPHFTLQGKYEIGGAQEPEAFVGIFEKVKAMESK